MSTSQNRPPPKTLLVSESFWSKRTNAIFKTAKQTKASVSAQTRQVNGWTQRVNIKRRRRSRTLHEELWSRIFSSTVYYTQPSCLFRLLPDISFKNHTNMLHTCKHIQYTYTHLYLCIQIDLDKHKINAFALLLWLVAQLQILGTPSVPDHTPWPLLNPKF